MNQAEDIGEHVQDRLSTGERLLVVVAGPNGAGKSTFVDTFLRPTGLRVVNPDQIARALAPDDPSAMAADRIERFASRWCFADNAHDGVAIPHVQLRRAQRIGGATPSARSNPTTSVVWGLRKS